MYVYICIHLSVYRLWAATSESSTRYSGFTVVLCSLQMVRIYIMVVLMFECLNGCHRLPSRDAIQKVQNWLYVSAVQAVNLGPLSKPACWNLILTILLIESGCKGRFFVFVGFTGKGAVPFSGVPDAFRICPYCLFCRFNHFQQSVFHLCLCHGYKERCYLSRS